jgi:hypothetical protein
MSRTGARIVAHSSPMPATAARKVRKQRCGISFAAQSPAHVYDLLSGIGRRHHTRDAGPIRNTCDCSVTRRGRLRQAATELGLPPEPSLVRLRRRLRPSGCTQTRRRPKEVREER